MSAVQEAENWQQNAASWCEALLQQHPLYRDVVQPVALAIYEVRSGLSLLLHAATQPEQQLTDALLEDTMSLPSRLGQGKASLLSWGLMHYLMHYLTQWSFLCEHSVEVLSKQSR